jgi:hypothetical protein
MLLFRQTIWLTPRTTPPHIKGWQCRNSCLSRENRKRHWPIGDLGVFRAVSPMSLDAARFWLLIMWSAFQSIIQMRAVVRAG